MDDNWHDWKACMDQLFVNCNITEYISGQLKWPVKSSNLVGHLHWKKNDMWAQQVIISNVMTPQQNHIRSKKTAAEMYATLSLTHKAQASAMVAYLQMVIYETRAKEGNNLNKHLNLMKSYQDKINAFPHSTFHIDDHCFKAIISQSLPFSWHSFVKPYNINASDPDDPDPTCHKSADAFIGLICEEYHI